MFSSMLEVILIAGDLGMITSKLWHSSCSDKACRTLGSDLASQMPRRLMIYLDIATCRLRS